MNTNRIDLFRAVAETAVRLYLGATSRRNGSLVEVALDGRTVPVSLEMFSNAEAIVRALRVRDRSIETASDVLELRRDAEDLFLAELCGEQGGPRILFVPAGEIASAYYRARLPAEFVSQRGTAIADFTDRLDLGKALRYDILWVQLVVAPVLLSIVRAAKEKGVKIVYDFDDAFWCIPPSNPASEIYVREKRDQIMEMIGLSDLVTVSTPALAQWLAGACPDVHVCTLPNLVPAAICPQRKEPDPERFTILWAGSPTHQADLAVMAPGLAGFLADHPEDARFVCFGEQIPKALLPVRSMVEVRRFVDFADYMTVLAEIGADVAVAPLSDNEFNGYKSDVKANEYAACGYPMLLSPVGQYPETVKAGLPATLVPDEHWRDALELAYQWKHVLPERGKAAREWVLTHRCLVRTGAKQWADAARELVCSTEGEQK